MATEQFAKPLPRFFLGETAADQRITAFMESKHPVLSDALAKEDTKSIWYSMMHIETLYKELVYLNADGLRIYFGQYEADHPDFSGQLCLVMVPTRLNNDTEGHEDVILEEDADFANRPGSESFINPGPDKAYNYGAPCPTICAVAGVEMKYPLKLRS